MANAPISQITRNNCYSLLWQLLDENKDVTLLRFIKRENPDLKGLLKRVSMACKSGEKQLEAFAKADPSLALHEYNLPLGEVRTRDSISKMKEHQMLHSSGDRLEIWLLLSQAEALNYGSNLAKVAAANETQPDRARYLMGLSMDLGELDEEIVTRLAVRLH